METATKAEFTYNDIYDTVTEFHWMINELERLKGQFDAKAFRHVHSENVRQRQKLERAQRFERRIQFIQLARTHFAEPEIVCLDGLLDGLSIKDIATLLRMNKRSVYRMRDRIVLQIFETQTTIKGGKSIANTVEDI